MSEKVVKDFDDMSNLYTGIHNATSKTAVDLKGKDGLIKKHILTKENALFGGTSFGLYNLFSN
jgi:hypothetical protein